MSYSDQLSEAMTWLGLQEDTIFIGQGVCYPGHGMFSTLKGVPLTKRIELPVAEEMQLGMSLGMALTGKTVISIYPRFDFLLCAMNQLVNHVDKLEDFSHHEWKARVIVRVGTGSTSPLHPGPQHCGDYTDGLQKMLRRVVVVKLKRAADIVGVYGAAYAFSGSSVIIEDMNLYGMV